MPKTLQEPWQTRLRSITGRHNPLLKELRQAYAKGINDEGCFAIEGLRLAEEAIRSGVRLRAVFFSEAAGARGERLLQQISSRVEAVLVPDDLFRGAVDSDSPQGIAALVHKQERSLEDALSHAQPSLLVVAAGLQDPGNLGTLIRSADAFGAGGLVLGEGTANAHNPKCTRATAGSIFRVPLVEAKLKDLVPQLRALGLARIATSSHQGTRLDEADLRRPLALFVGNEGAGLARDILDQMDEIISIPHMRPVESLNAGVAASVVLYEAMRQRK